MKTDYTRDELVAICERAIVPEEKWSNRDSHSAHEQLGQAWALLRAGCRFTVDVRPKGDDGRSGCFTDEQTIWITVEARGFEHHDYGGGLTRDTFYLPTPARFEERSGRDWY